jgi:hypothetical protein
MSLFDQLSGFEFPDVLMNSGPLPSTAGGPAGSDGSIDGVINGTSALLENISPYAIGKSARTGSDRNYQQIPHRFQYIIPRLYIPHFDNDRRIHISHAVDQGDIAFLLYGGNRAWLTSDNQFGTRAPPCAFATIEVVNYILLCIQASKTKNWNLVRDDLIKHQAFKEAMNRRTEQKTQDFDDFYIFKAIRLLIQHVFVPHGICAGSEHQGGQHEHTGGHPVQAAVNFVTTMTIDGKNVDLVNYWYGLSMVAGDELIFRLEKQEIKESKEFHLSRYYKEPVSVAVNPYSAVDLSKTPQIDHFYWQLVPDIVRKTPVQADTFDDTKWWCDHRCEGYWRIAQTFQTRAQNNSINAFTRGLPLEVTFAPVYQSFADCEYERASHAELKHSVDRYADVSLTATVTPDKISWNYRGEKDTISIQVSKNGYHIRYNPQKCQVHVNAKEQKGPSFWNFKSIQNIQFFCKDDITSLEQDVESSDVDVNENMQSVSNGAPEITFGTNPKPKDTTSPNKSPDFFVRISFDETKKEGFMHRYAKKYAGIQFDSNFWLENEKNYRVLEAINFKYTSTQAQSSNSNSSSQNGSGGGNSLQRARIPAPEPPSDKNVPNGTFGGAKKQDVVQKDTSASGADAQDVPVKDSAEGSGNTGEQTPAPAADAGGLDPNDTSGDIISAAKMNPSATFPTAASFGLAPQFEDAMSKKKRKTLKIFDDIV